MRLGLGIDTGGTFTKVFAVGVSGRVVAQAQTPTLPERGPADYVRRLAATVRELEDDMGRRADAACLGVAGDVDPVGGRLRRSPNLGNFERYPLRGALEQALGRPVAVHNDANMAAWGCYVVELKRRLANVAAITLGTGVGGGLVLGGRLYEGSTGSAAEFGHMRVAAGGERCACGAHGCLEAYAGAGAIVRRARRLLEEQPKTRSRLRRERFLDPRLIAEAARKGDGLARRVFRDVGRSLGVGIVNLVYLFNPDAVVIVGGVSKAGSLFLGEVRHALRRESFRTPFSRVRVVVAKSAQLGSIGAALFALEGAQVH